ncbi:interleukin-12 subunit beta [Pleurodeles waltl]
MPSLVTFVLALVLAAVPLEGKWELRNNVYVVDLGKQGYETVELVCDVAAEDTVREVKWRNGPKIVGHGKKLHVTIKEFPHAGNYTCHVGNGPAVGYTFVYINEPINQLGEASGILKEWRDGHFIDCEAKNYNGSFYCSWQLKGRGEPHFFFEAQHGTIKCMDHKTMDGSIYTITCIHAEACPYGEDHKHIKVFLEATQGKKYSNYTTTFFIKDIIKPDPPENLQKKGKTITWHYPASWSNCPSFFPLVFNVSVPEADRGQHHGRKHSTQPWILANNTSIHMPNVKKVCIQARDKYHTSSWSERSCYSV